MSPMTTEEHRQSELIKLGAAVNEQYPRGSGFPPTMSEQMAWIAWHKHQLRSNEMKVSEEFSGNYLTCDDFASPINWQIEKVTKQEMHDEHTGQMVEKWCLHFMESDKPMVLNKTNATTLAGMFGDDSDTWKDKEVCVFNDISVRAFGKVGGIRIKPRVAADGQVAPPSGAIINAYERAIEGSPNIENLRGFYREVSDDVRLSDPQKHVLQSLIMARQQGMKKDTAANHDDPPF